MRSSNYDWEASERVTPTRAPTWEADAGVPVGQSLALGLFLTCPLAVLVLMLVRPWGYAALLAVMFWLSGAGVVMLWRLRVTDAGIWERVRVARGDRAPAEPDGSGLVLVNPARGRELQRRQLAGQLAGEFAVFVIGCAEGDTSARRWESQLGRGRYQLWRDRLIEAGFAAWATSGSRKDGWRLTSGPDEIIAALGDAAELAGLSLPALPAGRQAT